MRDWEERRDRIIANIGANPGIRVLVVEGEDDRRFIEALLTTRQGAAWKTSWIIGEAGGKTPLLKILENQPTWFALIDKDEWTDTEVATKQSEFPRRLYVLPRFCMENYHVIPTELWGQLEPARQQAVVGGFAAFEAALLQPLHEWVTHGALWHAVNPLQESLRALGFKTDLLDFQLANSGDAQIRARLTSWHNHLDPERVMGLYHTNLAAANAAHPDQQLRQWVHGKRFFRNHVIRTISTQTHVASPTAEALLSNLQVNMPLPPDLQPVWTALGLP